jgi:hypothetical protein
MKENNKVFEFPCFYPLKVMGKNTHEFYSAVSRIIEKHVDGENKISYFSRVSSGNKYISITATFRMESEAQLQRIYRELNDNEMVLMTL